MAVIQNDRPEKFIYKLNEYSGKFTGNKGSEENAIVAIMMKLLNDNKFDNIDDLLRYNGNSLRTFLKNNNRDVVPLHYGANIKESDFEEIVKNFKEMVNNKMQFEDSKIHELNFDNKDYVEYDGHVIDNSLAERSISDEFKYMQRESTEYQSFNAMNNADNMANEVINDKKREVEFTDLDLINRSSLNEKEQKIYDAALVDQHLNDINKQVSLEDGLTIDENNNVSQLTEKNGNVSIDDNENEIKKTSISQLSDINSDNLTSTEKDIYNAALKYQQLTGELVRLDLDNMIIITPYDEIKEIIMDDNGSLVVDDDRILNGDTMTSEEDREYETQKSKVKTLEYPNSFIRQITEEEAA